MHTTRRGRAQCREQRREPVRFEASERFPPPLRIAVLARWNERVEKHDVFAPEQGRFEPLGGGMELRTAKAAGGARFGRVGPERGQGSCNGHGPCAAAPKP